MPVATLNPQQSRRIFLRECPPPFGLLLDFAAEDTPCLLLNNIFWAGESKQSKSESGLTGCSAEVKEEREARGTRSPSQAGDL